MSEYVILVHGDLLTKEHLDSVRESRAIEETPKNRFQYLVFLLGLFHYKMACVDALFRTYLQPKEGRDDENSLHQHIGLLCPDETGKMTSKPGFRRMHEVVHHDLWALILDCWQLEAQKWDRASTTLELFSKAKPSWMQITQMSHAIIHKYLLYVDLCHAMNAGDIGRVEASFLPWVYIFRATGKHKYATHMTKFLINMNFNYPTSLCDVIRRNLLCNPMGKENEFRTIDWLVERNNLYTKVIFSGTGPNQTIKHIIKESPLIEVYRHCHVTVENAFHLQYRTLHHSPPDMTKTIQRLAARIKEKGAHTFRHRCLSRL
ncbi:hypothetical protein SCLCIDRAFT_17457 [Scleroderma citrinum Foug A]|uniref:DUF6589 domain-containing protein n=1 Tax=Scleroderma citrinum Foug A TaxID=1036808 RepID=A0A0C3D2M6_9AGAM|nr:hypothetical protein SCLCIDRAFT_17457 [Scleroderma citrinum Foug A]